MAEDDRTAPLPCALGTSQDHLVREAFPLLGIEALAVLERLETPVYIYGFESGRICWANPSARKFWNASGTEELESRDVEPQLRANRTRLAQYRSAFRRGESRRETWTLFPDGIAVSALCHCTGISLPSVPEAMLVEILEGTATALQETELRSIEALRHTPLMISLLDLAGAVLMRNPAASAAFADFDLALSDGADAFAAMFVQSRDASDLRLNALRDGFAEATVQIGLDPPQMHHLQVTKVADPATGKASLLVAQQDVSALIETSRRLAASEDALDRLLDLNFSPVLIVSASTGLLLRWNQAADRLLRPGDGLIEAGAKVFAYDADFARLATTARAEGYASDAVQLLREDKRTFWAHLSGTALGYHNREALVFFVADIDQLHRSASDLEAELSLERQANEMQRQIMAIASHEFRTPLALIDSAAQRLEAHAESWSHVRTESSLRRIRRSVRQLLSLIERTIAGEKATTLDRGTSRAPHDLARLIETCAHSLRELYPQARIKLNLRAAPRLLIDAALMEGAMMNLIGNAIKYSDGPAEIEITAVEDRYGVTVTVRDHGIGIPAEERSTVFEEFFRGTNVGNRAGTGLGLAIVKRAVESHGGQVELAQVTGRGTAFRVHLPRTIFA